MAIKVLEFPCNFQGGKTESVKFYVGNPMDGLSPIQNQVKWLSDKGGSVPPETVEYLTKITELAKQNNQEVGEFLEYALNANAEQERVQSPAEQAIKKHKNGNNQ